MSIDRFFHRKYDANTYNCAHFVAEVYHAETGNDISKKLAGFLFPVKGRFVSLTIKSDFRRVYDPVDNCLVVMHRPNTTPHVGLYLRGKVLHLTESGGVQYMPLDIATQGYSTIRFYICQTA